MNAGISVRTDCTGKLRYCSSTPHLIRKTHFVAEIFMVTSFLWKDSHFGSFHAGHLQGFPSQEAIP